jgi:single-strand DNA-binding protein
MYQTTTIIGRLGRDPEMRYMPSGDPYLHKGSMVLVEGRLSADTKTGGPKTFTRQDGTVSASFEIVANTVRFLSPKSEGGTEGGEAAPAGSEHEVNEEGIPF